MTRSIMAMARGRLKDWGGAHPSTAQGNQAQGNQGCRLVQESPTRWEEEDNDARYAFAPAVSAVVRVTLMTPLMPSSRVKSRESCETPVV